MYTLLPVEILLPTAELLIIILGLVFIGIIEKLLLLLLLICAGFELPIGRIDKLLTPAIANAFKG